MKHIKYFFVVTLLFVTLAASGQTNYQQQYLNAKSLYAEGDFALAAEAFKPLIRREPGNPFAPYASYYYGVSTFKAGNSQRAKDILLQTRERFPNWSRVDEINYWLALCYFENNDDFLALNVIASIKDPEIASQAEALTYNSLMDDSDVKEIEGLYEKYKTPSVGRVYATKLSQSPMDAEHRKTLENLIERYDLNPDKYLRNVQTSEKKDSYKVAILLPLMVDGLRPNDSKRVNSFVIDLYRGIRLGFDSLRKSGINIDVFAYDTKRDSTVTKNILANDEMKGMDLIIGPLFSGPIKVVNDFSHKWGITIYNPLSSSTEYLNENPFYYIMQPNAFTIGEVMADYSFETFGSKNGMVIYGDVVSEQLMAQAFADRMNELGGKLALVREIDKDRSREVLELLLSSGNIKEAASEEGRENMSIAQDSIDYIFVASSNSLIFSKVISAVETRGDSISIIGSAAWMDMPVVSYESFERLGVTFYAPVYINRRTRSYQEFRKKYLHRHREIPTEYAEKGYETAIFLGRSLFNFGNYPQVGWQESEKIDGYLSPGFSYMESQDNQLLPILYFGPDGLEMTNRLRAKATEEEEK